MDTLEAYTLCMLEACSVFSPAYVGASEMHVANGSMLLLCLCAQLYCEIRCGTAGSPCEIDTM
jgi:hypothetical protein